MNIFWENDATYKHIALKKMEMELDGVIDAQGESNLECNLAKNQFWKDWFWAHLPVWGAWGTAYLHCTILTVKKPNQTNKKSKQNKKPPYMFALGHFKSDLLAVEDKKRGVSQHFWDFSAQNMGLGPLSLSQHWIVAVPNAQKNRFYPELHLGNLSVFSVSHRWPGEPHLACKTVSVCAEAWEGKSPAWL